MIPALAGFQGEHAVEIPFMLTTKEEEDYESGRTGMKNTVDWGGLGVLLRDLMGGI